MFHSDVKQSLTPSPLTKCGLHAHDLGNIASSSASRSSENKLTGSRIVQDWAGLFDQVHVVEKVVVLWFLNVKSVSQWQEFFFSFLNFAVEGF